MRAAYAETMRLSALSLLCVVLLHACTSSDGGSPVASASDGGTTNPGDSGATPGPDAATFTCDTDPLKTGLTPPDGSDAYDCILLKMTEKYAEPDAMIFKAIIHVESRFQVDAKGCTAPCGTPSGWAADEVQCLGLMQIVPACNPKAGDLGLLADGHPNMTVDQGSPQWATSIFNPAINIERGVAGIADNRAQVVKQFPGCTQEQYTLMAIGNYNSYGSTKSCTLYNTAYDDEVLKDYKKYSSLAGWPVRAY